MSLSKQPYIRSLLILLVCMAGFGSCVKDKASVIAPETGDGDAYVRISIHTPGSSVPQATRNATADECIVNSVSILVLEQNGTTYRFKYRVDGQQIQNVSDNLTTFNALLSSSDVGLKLILLANVNDALDNARLMAHMSEEEVIEALTDSFTSDVAGNLPLYGEATLPNLDAEQPNNLSVTMLRAVARVDVLNKIDTNFSENFSMESVHIFRANNKLRLVPDPSAMKTDGSLSVASPTVPASATRYAAYDKSGTAPLDGITQLYLPEAESVPESGDRLKSPSCVVVGGYFADDKVPSYYRVDFNSGLEAHPFGQVLRNHKYIFEIVQVTGRGWPTPDEAANNEATAITATMQIWDEVTSEMYFCGGGNYLGVSSREVILEYVKGAEETVYLQTTLPFNVQPVDENGNLIGEPITAAGEEFDNGFFSVRIVKDAADGKDKYRLLVTTLDDNQTDQRYTGKFKVFHEFWTFDVTVIQKTLIESYKDRYVNILTVTSLPGDLGTADGTFVTELSGIPMRKIIENPSYFSNAGIIPVKGMIVHDFTNAMMSSADAEFLAILEKMLDHIDVVHLPMGSTPSVQASALIYNWLTANTHRVLIMGLDTKITNANLRGYFEEDGTWFESETDVTSLSTPYYDDRQEPFFHGPFGEVPTNMTDMGYINASLSYNNGYIDETTTPLLVISTGMDNQWKLTHGVNKALGVFYWGDSEIATGKGFGMSATAEATGIITTEFDNFMGNVWAWIANRVVTGVIDFNEPW